MIVSYLFLFRKYAYRLENRGAHLTVRCTSTLQGTKIGMMITQSQANLWRSSNLEENSLLLALGHWVGFQKMIWYGAGRYRLWIRTQRTQAHTPNHTSQHEDLLLYIPRLLETSQQRL